MRRSLRELDRERVLLGLLVVLVIVFDAIYLLPEVVVPVPSNNDDAFHFLYVQRALDALAHGENPFDVWTPQLELGFATFVHYQFLPHLAVVALDRLLLGAVDAFTLFNIVRYLLLVLFPVTVLWSMRRFGFSPAASAFSAAVSPLISTPFLLGFDYDSYVWRGYGVYTQLWGMHLAFISLAATHTVITRGRGHLLALIACALLVLSHLLYAYFVAICVVVLLLANVRRATWRRQLRDLALVAMFAVAVSAYMWLPWIQLGAFMNVSPYLQPEKYDGFGAQKVLTYLVTGQLFDYGRLPVLSILVAAGLASALVWRTRLAVTAAALFVLWIVLYFGRPTFGHLYDLLPFSSTLLIHRFSGPVHLAGIVLVGVGVERAWLAVRQRRRWASLAFVVCFALALVPAALERAAFYEQNLDWMRQTRAAIESDADAATIIDAIRALPRGRVFAGLRTDYGPQLNFAIPFNSARFSDLLVFDGIDVVAPPYNSGSLSSDMIWDFSYKRMSDYDLFDVRYVVAPSSLEMPSFLVALRHTPRYVLYATPSSGPADYIRAGERRAARTQSDLVLQDRAWLLAADRDARGHVVWDYPASGVVDTSLPPSCAGTTRDERVSASGVELIASCASAGTLVLKVTYDPGWRVTIDGADVRTFMVSPAYLAVVVPGGTHGIVARYAGTPVRMPLLALGLVVLVAAIPLTRRLGTDTFWPWERR